MSSDKDPKDWSAETRIDSDLSAWIEERDTKSQGAGQKKDSALESKEVDYEKLVQAGGNFLHMLIDSLRLKDVESFLAGKHAQDVAHFLRYLSPKERVLAFRTLNHSLSVEVFSLLDAPEQEQILSSFNHQEASKILLAMPPDDRTEFFESLAAPVSKRLLKLLPAEERSLTQSLLQYPEDSAGRLMTPEYMELFGEMTVEQAMLSVKEQAYQKETIYTCYVVGEAGRLVGEVSLRDLIVAPPKKRIREVMRDEVFAVNADTDQEEVVRVTKDYNLLAVPVVDNDGKLLGIITEDDVMDVMGEESFHEYARLAGVSPEKDSFMGVGFWSVLVHRSVWVLGLLLLGSFSQEVIRVYAQNPLLAAHWTALSLFFTTLVGLGGNGGTQASILVIKDMMSGAINRHNLRKLYVRAAMMAFTMACVMAVVMFLRIHMLQMPIDPLVMWATVIATGVIAFGADMIGATIPIALQRVGIDPALVSAPLLATLMDLFGLAIYFEIARRVLFWGL